MTGLRITVRRPWLATSLVIVTLPASYAMGQAWLSGRLGLSDALFDWTAAVLLLMTPLWALTLFAVVFLLRKPMSVKFGEQLEVRYFGRTRTYDWSEIKRIELSRSERDVQTGLPVKLALLGSGIGHWMPLDETDLRITVRGSIRTSQGQVASFILKRLDRYVFHRWLRQRAAAHELEAGGGSLTWKNVSHDEPLHQKTGGAPTVVEVSFRHLDVTDADLAGWAEHLESFPDLETLDLSYTQVTDAGIEGLAGLSGLAEILIAGSQISPDAAKILIGQLGRKSRGPDFSFLERETNGDAG